MAANKRWQNDSLIMHIESYMINSQKGGIPSITAYLIAQVKLIQKDYLITITQNMSNSLSPTATALQTMLKMDLNHHIEVICLLLV